VAYCDYANLGKATVMEYNGSSWKPVGNPGFSSGEACWESLYVYNGTPYVAYDDAAYSCGGMVMEATIGLRPIIVPIT